jgi:ADP-ribose pyrophosphatase YjhB (NUDIX family)
MLYVSALIQDIEGPYGKVLLCKKPDGTWCLPSGQVHTAETAEQAVARIASEQLGLTIRVGKLELRGRHKQPDRLYDFHEYYSAVNIWQDAPHSESFTEFAWVHPTALDGAGFDGDDAKFLSKYIPWVTGRQIHDTRMY